MRNLLLRLSIVLTVLSILGTICNANSQDFSEPIKFIVTGGPGSGKTSTLLHLEQYHNEYFIPEAAADCQLVIKAQGNDQPWTDPNLDKKILSLQKKRLARVFPNEKDRILLDRSPIDILAYNPNASDELNAEIEKISQDPSYAKIVFLIEHLGFLIKTDYRNEDLEYAKQLETRQIENYTKYGFQIVRIPRDTVDNRSKVIIQHMNDYLKNSIPAYTN